MIPSIRDDSILTSGLLDWISSKDSMFIRNLEESTCDDLISHGEGSSDFNIFVIGVRGAIWTVKINNTKTDIDIDGDIYSDGNTRIG